MQISFGGNPHQIIGMGESAGALSLLAIISSPKYNSDFYKLILMVMAHERSFYFEEIAECDSLCCRALRLDAASKSAILP